MRILIDHYHWIYSTADYQITIESTDEKYLARFTQLQEVLTEKQLDRLITSKNGYGYYSLPKSKIKLLEETLEPYYPTSE